ncbi:MAG: glycerophosphodiester phosphodiesterase family protein, partial [Dokdonella sp.]
MAPSPSLLIIAHRGASALRPEHTLAAYEKAIDDGADFIEPDLVMTRDGVLITRHENAIGGTTDVATRPEFADRRATRAIDGETTTDWFSDDFSLAEIRTLRARERLPMMRGTAFDGHFEVPTFEQVIALVERKSREYKRSIGLIPEIKHSSYHHTRGLDPEQTLVDALQRHAYTRQASIGIQSFEVGNLQRLRSLLGDRANVFLVQLIGAPDQRPVDRINAADTY